MNAAIQKILVTILIIAVVAFLGYRVLIQSPDAASVDSGGIVGQDILALVEKMKTVAIDQSIFSSPLWASLRDSGATIFPEPTGRSNPFALLGSGLTLTSNTQASSPSTVKKQ